MDTTRSSTTSDNILNKEKNRKTWTRIFKVFDRSGRTVGESLTYWETINIHEPETSFKRKYKNFNKKRKERIKNRRKKQKQDYYY